MVMFEVQQRNYHRTTLEVMMSVCLLAPVLHDLKDLLELDHELPVGLLKVLPEVLLANVDRRPADLEREETRVGVGPADVMAARSVLTLLITMSFSSKCLPNILGDSPGMGSTLMQISSPFLAQSTSLWLFSMLVHIPISRN